MTGKPLPPAKTRALIEAFRKYQSEIEVFEVKGLPNQQRQQLLKESPTWMVVSKTKWRNSTH
jgi:hypothetical protein